MSAVPLSVPGPMRHRLWYRHRLWAAAAGAILLVGVGCGSSDSEDATTPTEPADLTISVTPVGDAPELELGEPTDTPLVVNVWATWCAPCRKEMPAFEAAAAAYRGKVRFVGVNLGDTPDAADTFIAETGVTFDQYLDPDMTAQSTFSIVSMPTTVLFDAEGNVAATHNGALDEAELEQLLTDELGVDAPAG